VRETQWGRHSERDSVGDTERDEGGARHSEGDTVKETVRETP
jgi:hypothetical protein